MDPELYTSEKYVEDMSDKALWNAMQELIHYGKVCFKLDLMHSFVNCHFNVQVHTGM